MDQSASSIQSQYAHGSLLDAIDAALAETGHSSQNPTVEDLSPVDGFHIRGRQATRELLRDLSLPDAPSVLDVGCGIGGTARFLADEFGARVHGVDLVDEYCDVARELTRRVGLSDQITFHQGNALDLPVGPDEFDLVLSEHVQMNIDDKRRYLREVSRVLRPGGRFAFYEIFAGPETPEHVPVPWADLRSVSFLTTPASFRNTLADTGFDVGRWTDSTDQARAWFEQTLETVEREGPPPLGIHLLMGAGAKEKMKNVVRNLREERIAVVSAVAHTS